MIENAPIPSFFCQTNLTIRINDGFDLVMTGRDYNRLPVNGYQELAGHHECCRGGGVIAAQFAKLASKQRLWDI